MKLGRYGSREILKLQIFDSVSSTPIMYFDYANTATQEWSSDRVYATGAGVRRIAWDGDKEETLTVETQIFTMQHLAMLAGEEIKKGAQNIYKTEILTVVDNAGSLEVELSKTPIGGADGVGVYAFVNGILTEGQPVESVTDKTVELASSATVSAGDEVEVYYQYEVVKASKLAFTAKGFPKYVKLVGDTLYADEVAEDMVSAQIVYHKAKLQPNFTIGMSSTGDPESISLVFDLFPVKLDGIDTTTELILYEDEE